MKKIVFLLAFVSVFYLFGCSNGNDSSSDVPSGSGGSSGGGNSVETDSDNDNIEFIKLIPSRNSKVISSLVYSIPKSTTTIFPYNFYSSEDCKIPVSDFTNVDSVYYDATNSSDEKIEEIFGKKKTSSRQVIANNMEEFDSLYIIGDFSKTDIYSNKDSDLASAFRKLEKDVNGNFCYSFIYSNKMKYWGNGDGNAAFQFTSKPEWSDDTIIWSQASVLDTGKNIFFISKKQEKESRHNLLTGLVEGNEYKFTVIDVSESAVVFCVEGKLSEEQTLLRGPFMRGTPSGWQYDKFSQNSDGSYYYDFTYSARMEEKLSVSDFSVIFAVLPSNSYAMGAYCGIWDEANDELSKTIVSVEDVVETSYYPSTNHNIVVKNLKDYHKYRINLSSPVGATIEDSVYSVKFEDLGIDENAVPFERRIFYGLDGWQCLGGFNNWFRTWTDSDGTTTKINFLTEENDENGKFWAYYFYPAEELVEQEYVEFKIMYGEWNWGYNYGDSKLDCSAGGIKKSIMKKDVGNAFIYGLDKNKGYKLKFTCSDTNTACNPGEVSVEIEEID